MRAKSCEETSVNDRPQDPVAFIKLAADPRTSERRIAIRY